MNEQDLAEDSDIERRLRTAFRAVAELPGPGSTSGSGSGSPATLHGQGNSRRRPPRRLLVGVASVAALALVVALALTFGPHSSNPPGTHAPSPASHSHSHSTPTTTPTPQLGNVGTERITYQPFSGATLKPDQHVSARESGTCFQYGGGAQGRLLYRCGTMQPCVASSQGTKAPLACPVGASPAANDVILWTATSVDTTGFTPATTKTPFAMQLSNGVVCELVNAAWSGLGPFGCGGSTGDSSGGIATSTPADCRQPVAAAPSWTAQCQDQLTQASPFTSTMVVEVWF
jgi:hypothetical protein